MGKQISNSSILLTSALPLDARSHFITYQEAVTALEDKQGVSVVRSAQDATVTSGIYQNYYYGQIITTEKHGTFTVVASSDYSAYKTALEKEWGDNDNVVYSYDSSSKTLTIEVKSSGTYVKAHKEEITITPTNNIDLSEKILPFYSFFGTEKPVLKSVISIINGALFINPKGQFIDDNFKSSSHLQPFSGSGGGGGGGSSIAGAKTTDGTTLQIVNNYLQVGNLAAKDNVKLENVDKSDTLYNLVNRTMNESQFELDGDT
jgi:hypothetical protein